VSLPNYPLRSPAPGAPLWHMHGSAAGNATALYCTAISSGADPQLKLQSQPK
jgi:hypothetical protein